MMASALPSAGLFSSARARYVNPLLTIERKIGSLFASISSYFSSPRPIPQMPSIVSIMSCHLSNGSVGFEDMIRL